MSEYNFYLTEINLYFQNAINPETNNILQNEEMNFSDLFSC